MPTAASWPTRRPVVRRGRWGAERDGDPAGPGGQLLGRAQRGAVARQVSELTTKATDVTAQYVDLQSQITALEASRQQYLTIMTKASSIGDVLAVQAQLDTCSPRSAAPGPARRPRQRDRLFDADRVVSEAGRRAPPPGGRRPLGAGQGLARQRARLRRRSRGTHPHCRTRLCSRCSAWRRCSSAGQLLWRRLQRHSSVANNPTVTRQSPGRAVSRASSPRRRLPVGPTSSLTAVRPARRDEHTGRARPGRGPDGSNEKDAEAARSPDAMAFSSRRLHHLDDVRLGLAGEVGQGQVGRRRSGHDRASPPSPGRAPPSVRLAGGRAQDVHRIGQPVLGRRRRARARRRSGRRPRRLPPWPR